MIGRGSRHIEKASYRFISFAKAEEFFFYDSGDRPGFGTICLHERDFIS